MTEIPADMVEAGAIAEFEADRLPGEPGWAELAVNERESYLAHVRLILTAALEGCEVCEIFTVDCGGVVYPCSDLARAWRQYGEVRAKGWAARIVRTYVITTPAVPVEETL